MNAPELTALRRTVALAPPRGRLVAWSLICATVAGLAAVALLAVSGALISKAALRPPVLSLSVLIVVVRALALTRAVARYGERLSSHDMALGALARLRGTFFGRLVARRPAGQAELLSRFVADVDRLQDLYLRALTPAAVAVLCSAATVLAATILLPAAGLVLVTALLAAGVLVPWAAARIAGSAARRQASARARLTAEVLEVTRHGAELAVLGLAGARAARLAAADADLARLGRRDALASSVVAAGSVLAQGAAVIGTLLVAIPATGSGRLDGILLAALVLLTIGAFESVAPLPGAAVNLAACAAAARRVTAVTDAPVTVVEDPAPVMLPPGGDLVLRGVRVGGEDGGPPLLSHVDLRIAEGETVALVGPSGAGKTTLAEVLVRFREPDSGSVRLAGVDLHRLRLRDVRHAVRLIAQDAGLFTTSVVENVRLARPGATDADVRRALQQVGLGPWIESLPDGLNTMVGEAGTTVSGGQRRRIAVARALIADARVLVVDEPTAHLDPESAQQVLGALLNRAHCTGSGLLAIVHPGCDLGGFDRVLELRDGRLGP